MKISCCPQCYTIGKLVSGLFIASETDNGEVYDIYNCPKCKEFYKEHIV